MSLDVNLTITFIAYVSQTLVKKVLNVYNLSVPLLEYLLYIFDQYPTLGFYFVHNFHTTTTVFIAILLAYLGLTLALGAKRVYFDRFVENDETEKK